MYWNPHSASSIDNLLNKHDTTLETLLNIDNIILQVKNGDSRLISYLAQPNHLIELLSYAVSITLPEDKAIKYPYVACEIICADNGRFIEAMRRNTNILAPLWSFLVDLKRPDPDAPINNSVTDGSSSAIQNASIFFSRLNIYLLGKMQSTMLAFLQERVPDAMQLLVKNLDLQPITELLYRFYALPAISNPLPSNASSSSLPSSRSTTPVLGNNFDIFTWLEESNLYAHLAAQFKPTAGQEAHESTSQFITGLFNLPFPDGSSKQRCLEPFLQASWLHSLLAAVFDSDAQGEVDLEAEESALLAALRVIGAIFKSIRELEAHEAATPFLKAFLETADTFFDLLTQRPSKGVQLPCGRVNALGSVRLAAIEMFLEALRLVSQNLLSDALHDAFLQCFLQHHFSPWMLEAFFSQFPQNSFLHSAFAKYIQLLCSRVDCLDALLKPIEQDLKHAIIRAQRENDALQVQPRQNRLPFMGHLMLVAEALCSLDERRALVSGSAFTVRDSLWHEFVSKSLKEAIQRNSQILGGIRPPLPLTDLSASPADNQLNGSAAGGQEAFLEYNAVFGSGDEEQLARYFVQQIIGNVPHQFLYDEYQRRFSHSDDDDDDDEDEEENSLSDSDDEEANAKGIEIPLLLGHGDFDEMMFEASFADSIDTDSMDDSEHSDSSDDDSEDYEMQE